MGLDLVQTPIIEATCLVVLVKALVLGTHPFPVWEQIVGVGCHLKIVDDVSGAAVHYAAVMVPLISLMSRTEGQGLQSQRVKSLLIVPLWIIISITHQLLRSTMNHTTNQNLSQNIKMPSFLSSNPTVKTMFTRVSNMVSGPARQMGTES